MQQLFMTIYSYDIRYVITIVSNRLNVILYIYTSLSSLTDTYDIIFHFVKIIIILLDRVT